MGDHRFLYDNKITAATMLSVSSLRSGTVTSAMKDGDGSAVISVGGSFSGNSDAEYIVEIDSIAGGAEVEQATFKWSDGGGSWNATGVTTAHTAITLNNGVTVCWPVHGAGADFVVGDRWYFKGINLFSPAMLIDLDRDHRYRSAGLGSPNTITVDLGSARAIQALILMDHNLTLNATITLKGNNADAGWGSPLFSESVTWAADKILHYLSATQTYRYWQIEIADGSNSDNYIEIGELFLGPYMELTRNYKEGFSETTEFLRDVNTTPYGVERSRHYNTRMSFSYEFNAMLAADVTAMKALVSSVSSRAAGTFKPFWFNKDSATPEETHLVKLTSLPVNHLTRIYYNMSLDFREEVTSV
jgi:hypothetical protein